MLNFGHCFGHAIESASDFAIPHGQAVVAGMILAGAVARRRGLLSEENHAFLIRELFLPSLRVRFRSAFLDPAAIVEGMKQDKKRIGDQLALIMIDDHYEMHRINDLTPDEVAVALREVSDILPSYEPQSLRRWPKREELMKDTIFGLSGRTALVTGGSKGLGKAMARAFAQAGADVFVTARTESALQAAATEIAAGTAARVEYVVADMARRDDVGRLAQTALERMGKIDILVNNAGANIPQVIDQVRDEDWDYLLELNLSSGMALSRRFAPGMKERRWGRIIHISSIMALASAAGAAPIPPPSRPCSGLARASAIDLGEYNITVNCLAPGPFATDLPVAVLTPEQWKALAASTALNRFGECHELVGPALLLASDAGSYITGSVLVVDGGAMAKAF